MPNRAVLALLGLGLLLAVASAAVIRSPFLALETVTVRGLGSLSREAVIATAGLELGTNLLRLRPAHMTRSLLAHPRIAAARVRLVWPRGVDLMITERRGICLVRCGDSWLEVAADGVVIAMHHPDAAGTLGLFELSGIEPSEVAIGGRLPGSGSIAALEALASIQASGEPVGRASLEGGGLEATLADGTILLLGPAGADLPVRTGVALALLAELRAAGRAVAYIDARIAGQPVIKPR